MSRLLVSLLFLFETSLLHHASKSSILLLLLLLCLLSSLFGSSQFVHGILTPVREVAITLHVFLRKAEYFKRLNEELFLRENVADKFVIVCWMIDEVVVGLCEFEWGKKIV